MKRGSVIRWYEGWPFYIEPPFPWAVLAVVIISFAIGFLVGLFLFGLV